MPGLTLQQARQRTNYKVGSAILQTVTVTDYFYRLIKWERPNSANSHAYSRRQGEVRANWVRPGQLVQKYDTVETTPISVQLAQAVNKFAMPAYVQDNMSDPYDQASVQITEAITDLARDVARTAINGVATDVCAIQAGGGVVAANVNGAITPGAYFSQNVDGQTGSIKFDLATSALSFRAPGDQDYGTPVVVAANGGPYTLRSKKEHLTITLSTAALPAADGHANLVFSSTTAQPDGLISLVDPAQLVAPIDAVNGDKISYEMIDALISKMGKFWIAPECAVVLHSDLFNGLLARGRLGGGVTFKEITMEGGAVLQTYRGMPVLQNDFFPTAYLNGNASHHLFVVNMNSEKGFFGVANGSPSASGFEGQVLDRQNGEYRNMAGEPIMGWKVKALGPAREFDGEESMVTWTGAFGIKGKQAAAARYGVIA